MSKETFENDIEMIDEIIEKLDTGELTLDESIKEYEEAMKLLKNASAVLDKAEGKILKVTEDKIEEIK